MSIREDGSSYGIENDKEVYEPNEAIEAVFDYLPEGEEVALEEVYNFVRDTASRESTFEVLQKMVGEEDIFVRLETEKEDPDFVYWN